MAGNSRISTDRFIHDTIDGETVIIDTIVGRLTVLVGIGPAIWTRLLAGTQPIDVIGEVEDVYGTAAVRGSNDFVNALSSAGLLFASDGGYDSGSSSVVEQPWPARFSAPGMEHYDDIADIMTMDPIHEVDTGLGWPNRGMPDTK